VSSSFWNLCFIYIAQLLDFLSQRKIKAPSPPPLDEDDSRRELVESDQEEMVQASDSEMQVKYAFKISDLSVLMLIQ
jgi:hypothetical protein